MDRIFKAAQGSAQFTEESKDSQGLIEPFFSFDRLSVNFLLIYDKMGVSQKMTHRIQF